jgi:serine/threonine protein kinase
VVLLLDSDMLQREIVLTYIPGRSLDKYTDHRELSILREGQCKRIWQGAANGLGWVHAKGIIHKDIKPGNIMYDPEQDRTILIDFGLATLRQKQHFSAGGTPWYVAPEYQLRQRSYASDVWSLAIVMFIALGLISFPDHEEPSWDLGKVFSNTADSSRMTKWLRKISEIKRTLPERHHLLVRMLESNPCERIGAKDVVKRLMEQDKKSALQLREL